jgi:cobalt-zinc-cadmium efflux system membrane fusion protein
VIRRRAATRRSTPAGPARRAPAARRPATRVAAALAAIAALSLAACGRRASKEEEQPPTPSARTPWVQARSSEGVPLLEAPASVLPSPEGSAGVVPPYRARVVRVMVRPGDTVRKGQPLVEVVMPEVTTAAGAYTAASTRLEAYGKRKAQLESLKADGLVRLADVLEAETKLAEARADQQAAAATLRAAQIDVADAAAIVAGSAPVTLRSPISGMVTAVHVAVGDSREPSGEAVVRIAGEGDSLVEARVSRPFESAGARYELVASNGVRYPLDLVARAPVFDPRDGTLAAWFRPPKGTVLPNGLSGRLVVTLRQDAGVAVVPARAVALAGGKAHVVAHRDGKPERVPVEVVASSGAEALVRGIPVGAEVAADAALAEVPAEKGAAAGPERPGPTPAGPDRPATTPAGKGPEPRP